jgi:hypothetical protein
MRTDVKTDRFDGGQDDRSGRRRRPLRI